MAFPFYKSIDKYIIDELQSRSSNNNVRLSKLVPWIKATSNLGEQYSIGTETYSTLFDNSPSDAYGNTAGGNWKYRPNPVITDFSVDFASRGTLRRCTLKIKCFSPEQLTKIQTYFLEPGISCYIQWGWNYSVKNNKAIGPTDISADTIKKYNRNAVELNSIRAANDGCYDNFVGIIGGGESGIKGTEFEVTVKLVSLGEILMGKNNESVVPTETEETETQQTSHPNSADPFAMLGTKGNFVYMFNKLPESLRTKTLLSKQAEFNDRNDFVNYISDIVEEAKLETSNTSTSGGGQLSYLGKTFYAADTESPVSTNSYMSFEAFIKLLNMTRVQFQQNDILDFNIDIKDSYCGAFKRMWSTDERVLIPNQTAYNFLNDIPLLGGFPFDVLYTGLGSRVFVRARDSVVNSEGQVVTLPAFKHGWIGDIYIEHEMACEALNNQNTPVKELLDEVLSKMSDAVEGLWSFQIVEEKAGANMRLRIVDGNLRNLRSGNEATEFTMFGADSFFLDASFNLDIPKEMASKVYMEKSTDGVQATDELTGLFSNQKDNILGDLNLQDIKATATPALEPDPAQNWIEFRRNIRIVCDPVKATRVNVVGNLNMQEWAVIPIYLNKRKFNDIRKVDLGYTSGGEVYNGRSLPVAFDFTILGMSGFQVGHLFNVKGLPPQYSSAKGAFQIEEITHKIDGKQWITEVKSHFRPFYK